MHEGVNSLHSTVSNSRPFGNKVPLKALNLVLKIGIAMNFFLYEHASMQTETHSFSLCTEALRKE